EGETRRELRQVTVPHLRGANYVRNAVKAVVDAYDGSVDFYVVDQDDPVIRVWQRVFPGLFQERDAMPPGIAAHIRYPVDLLLVQGLVYAKYHMRDPAVFYNQEDLWVRATENYRSNIRPVDPYYVIWQRPGESETEFVLMLPFTPKNRQVLIGWIAGRCDGEHYGKFLAYKFPKEKRILGTQQVETKIDQDPYLSGQLSLWDQRGSQVIRGNVLAIPIDRTLLYVEPIYLQAETAAYPELRLVAVMHRDRLSYGETLDAALDGLLGEQQPPLASPSGTVAPDGGRSALARRAQRAFERYLDLQAKQRFAEAAAELESLRQSLEELVARGEDD
ncbi:MAG: UPF0182 family protein, partial [Candidatus Eiseniibacteriota bacterium]